MKNIVLLFLLWFGCFGAMAQSGTITVTSVQQRPDGSGVFDVHYNLSGSATSYNILVEVSFDGGTTFTAVPASYLSGDVTVGPGSNRHIVWNGMGSFPNQYSTNTQIKLTAISSGGDSGTFTDSRDGQTYKWVKIGNQVWMAENLNFASANSWCYDNNATNCDHYGRLYNWAAVMNGASSSSANPSGVQGVCPTGWHVPSHDEWTQLEQYVCNQLGNSDCATKFPYANSTWFWRGTNEGNALKSCRQVGSPLGGCNTSDHPRWASHSTHYGTDAFGFSALPGGCRFTNGSFGVIGSGGWWWSSTERSSADAWDRHLRNELGGVSRDSRNKATGFSLRCVRD